LEITNHLSRNDTKRYLSHSLVWDLWIGNTKTKLDYLDWN